MDAALWVFTSFLVVCVTLISVGIALRPYVADLTRDRNQWQARAQLAEAEIEAHISTDVRLVNPKVDTMEDLDVFLKGMSDE